MKRFFLFSISFLLLLVIAACGNNTERADSDDEEEIVLTFTTWGGDEHIKMYEDLLEDFYEENPNIKVNVESIPHADYQQKLSVLAAGNELPDVGWVAERMVPQFEKNNILSDITEVVESKEFDLEDYIPSTLDLWNNEGKLYGIPFSTPPMIMYYNKSLFEDAGLETPTELALNGEWTWDKFEETAKSLSEGEGTDRIYGARLFNEWTNFATIPSYTLSYGGEMFNDDMTQFEWNSKQGVDSLDLLNRMMFEDKSHVPPGENIDFESGKVGMFTFMYSYIANVRDITDFDWDIAPLPEGSEGRYPLLGQAGISVFEGSQHPEEAKKLLAFLGSKKGIQAQSAYFVPARKSVLESDEFINIENNPPKESIELALIQQMDHGFTYPLHEDWTKIESEINNGFDKLFSQSESTQDIMNEMEDAINPLLQK